MGSTRLPTRPRTRRSASSPSLWSSSSKSTPAESGCCVGSATQGGRLGCSCQRFLRAADSSTSAQAHRKLGLLHFSDIWGSSAKKCQLLIFSCSSQCVGLEGDLMG